MKYEIPNMELLYVTKDDVLTDIVIASGTEDNRDPFTQSLSF